MNASTSFTSGTMPTVRKGWSRSSALGGSFSRNCAMTPSKNTEVTPVRCTVSQNDCVLKYSTSVIEACWQSMP